MKDLLTALVEGCQRAARIQFEGRSSARGPTPRWLEAAADFDVVAIREGSTQLLVEAKPLRDIVPDPSGQEHAYRPLTEGVTALDLFHQGLRAAAEGGEDSDAFDVNLLKTFGRLKRVLDHGFDEIDFDFGEHLRVNARVLEAFRELRSRVPEARHVRITGKLDQIRHRDRRFVLVVGDEQIRGVADEVIDPEQLGSLFGKQVVATGDVVFRPSGRVLRIDATHLQLAGSGASAWAKMPRPLFDSPRPRTSYVVEQTPETGLGAIFGRWPGEETDEELLAVMEQSA